METNSINGTAIAERAARIESFKNLKPEMKRVEIAKDVLDRIETKRLIAKSGDWLITGDSSWFFDEEDIDEKELLSDKFEKMTGPCQACALGSLFMCAVEMGQSLTCDKVAFGRTRSFSQNQLNLGLNEFFDSEQLSLIEQAFEKGRGGCPVYSSSPLNKKCAAIMYPRAKNTEERMQLIMQNIIDNNGTFVVNQSPQKVGWIENHSYNIMGIDECSVCLGCICHSCACSKVKSGCDCNGGDCSGACND